MDIQTALDELEDKDAINIHADDTIDTTRFGRAVAMSFLSVDDGVIIKDSINDSHYLSQYYKKPFFKTNLKELRLLAEKIDEENENILKKNKKIKNNLNKQVKDSSKKSKKEDIKESKKKNKPKKDHKKNKKNNNKNNKKSFNKNSSNKSDKPNKSKKDKKDKTKEKSIKPKVDKSKDKPKDQFNDKPAKSENSGIKFIVEEDLDEKPIKKETKKESKTSKYIDNIADFFNQNNQSKDYKSSNADSKFDNKKTDYKSSKSDKSRDVKSDVIYNKKTNNKNNKNKTKKNKSKSKDSNKSNKEQKSAVVKQIKFKENIFSDIHEKMTKEEVNSNNLLKVQSIALDLELFENAYLAPVVHKQIISALKMNFSTRLFSESTLDIISSGEAISKLDKKFQDALLKLQIDFLRCDCYERPFCECLQRGISYYIINQRLNGKDPIDISKSLLKEYQIQTYPGDIFSWLDAYVRNLDAIRRIARAFGEKDIVESSEKLMKIVESGK